MEHLQVFNRLLQFPLFQGMGKSELSQVLAHTKFGFDKYETGKRVIRKEEVCRKLHFLTHGDLRVTTETADGSCIVDEQVTAPYTLQTECLFGLPQRFRSSFVALSPVNFITLDKQEVLRLCQRFEVFQLNMFNQLAAQSQRLLLQPWQHQPATLRQHIASFLLSRCQTDTGAKCFHILMATLAQAVNDSRLDVSNELRAMERDGLLNLSRGKIHVPDVELLHRVLTG